MPLPPDADIPFILSRIRPNASWGWKGEDRADPANLDWRDEVQTEPTQLELVNGWTAVVASRALEFAAKQTLKTNINAVQGRAVSALTNIQLSQMVEVLMVIVGGLDLETKNIKPANQWGAARRILESE